MYIKCFFALSGNLNAEIIYAAASQCNISSSFRGVRGYVDRIGARYQQALRHMWGMMDTGYAIRQAIAMFARSRKTSAQKQEEWWRLGLRSEF